MMRPMISMGLMLAAGGPVMHGMRIRRSRLGHGWAAGAVKGRATGHGCDHKAQAQQRDESGPWSSFYCELLA